MDGEPGGLHLRRWRDPNVVALALLAMAAGFGQFGVVAALGDVARTFGSITKGASLSDQAGLSGTTLGLGLSVIRLASLGGIFLAGLADRAGRRRTLLVCCAAGLALTVASAASPGFWWFVAIFALGRPLLSATNALAGVCAAEETASANRTKAVAMVAAGYAIGAGLLAILHGLVPSLGFRGTVLLGIVPLACIPLLAKAVKEPDRYARYSVGQEHRLAVVAAIAKGYRGRLALISIVVMGVSVITGPANSFVFLYAENVAHLSGATTAAMVTVAGVTGFAGLLLGRYLADTLGRRSSIAIGVAAVVACGVLTYAGSGTVIFVGYVLGVLAAAVLAPSAGAYVNELFPTAVRASVAGFEIAAGVVGAIVGLLAFGSIADVGNRFGWAAAFTFVPALLFLIPLAFLPETRGREPEDLWPVSGPADEGSAGEQVPAQPRPEHHDEPTADGAPPQQAQNLAGPATGPTHTGCGLEAAGDAT